MKSKKELADQCRQRINNIRENIEHFAKCKDWEMVQMNEERLAYNLKELEKYL